MGEIFENDNYHLPECGKSPQTPEEIAEAQTNIEAAFARTDAIRAQIGLPPVGFECRIARYRKLNIPVPETYQQKNV